jgi:hypothetical protein
MMVTLPAGMHSVMGDTTGQTTGLVDIGANCGGQMAGEMQAPEQVLALTLPGTSTDHVTVSFTFLNAGTDVMFDTTTQLRNTCRDATGATCFDDATTANDYRSEGTFNGMGGQTVYLIVSGYRMPLTGYHNVGPWQADFNTFVNPTPPTLASATATLLDGDLLTVEAMGTDPQSAAAGVVVTYLDSTGAPIGLDLDMDATTPDQTDLGPYAFRPAVTGMMTFDGTSRITGWNVFPVVATAPQMRISVTDSAGLMSNELTITLNQAMTVHVGDACDTTHVCPAGVDCTSAVCTVPAAVATACAAATALTVATPTTTTTSATTGTLTFTTGTGLIESSCIGTGGMGDEHIFSVDVPAGNFDLLADTPDMGEMGFDSVVYDRTVCGDPSTETACNDDRSTMPHSLSSHIEVLNAAMGTHFVFVDSFDTLTAMSMATTTTLTVSLRPVLASGATCDPMGVMNRCAGTACPTTGTATCP